MLTEQQINQFQTKIKQYYQDHGREFDWRTTNNPYHILVSEIMLQQTQTHRVLPKYRAFIQILPTITSLAQAPLQAVLSLWQGLGYNRRGKALHQAAQLIMMHCNGSVPADYTFLQTLPGIGPYTAGAICAFAFNQPTVFIETNIRTVFIHEFFSSAQKIQDKEILALIEQTLDQINPKKWYYALMDYGAMLKKKYKLNTKSAHYTKQSTFKGSVRELRGKIIKQLTLHGQMALYDLELLLKYDSRITRIIHDLTEEKFIIVINDIVQLR